MISNEEAFTEVEYALGEYNECASGDYGFSIDKDSGVITLEKYGDFNESTGEVDIEENIKFMLVRYSD